MPERSGVAGPTALRGLICFVTRDEELRSCCPLTPTLSPCGGEGKRGLTRDDLARIELSGPFALFRRTLLYGRALGAVVPVLAWTRRFKLEATCDIRGRRALVTLATGDPIFPSSEPRPFDRRLEERFARDFARLAPARVVRLKLELGLSGRRDRAQREVSSRSRSASPARAACPRTRFRSIPDAWIVPASPSRRVRPPNGR